MQIGHHYYFIVRWPETQDFMSDPSDISLFCHCDLYPVHMWSEMQGIASDLYFIEHSVLTAIINLGLDAGDEPATPETGP